MPEPTAAAFAPTSTQRIAARVAGVAYPLMMALVVYANFGIHGRLVDGPHRADALRNIAAAPGLFHLGIGLDLLYCIGVVALVTALHAVLRPVRPGLAGFAAACGLVYAGMWLLMTLDLLAAQRLATPPAYLHALDPRALQDLAALHLAGRYERYYVGLLFYGLGWTAWCVAWLRSRYIPRALAVYGLAAAALAAVTSLALFLDPGLPRLIDPNWYDVPLALFDLGTSALLIVRGLRPPAPAAQPAAAYS